MNGQPPKSTRRMVPPPPPPPDPIPFPFRKVAVIAGAVVAAGVIAFLVFGRSSEPPVPQPESRKRASRPAPLTEPAPAPQAEKVPEGGIRILEAQAPAAPPPKAEPAAPPPPPVPAAAAEDLPKQIEAALAAGRLEEVAQLMARLRAMPDGDAAYQGLKKRLDAAREAQVLEAAREGARGRVLAAREEIAREERERREREARLETALKEYAERHPLRIKLGEDLFIDQVKVAAYSGGLLKLVWPQGAVDYPLDTLPEGARTLLLSGILPGAAPRDQFEVGKVYLRTGDYDRAASCFAKVAAADPSLKPLCPDVERVKRMSRVFEGTFRISGNDLGIGWSFRKPDEAKDFIAQKESRCAILPEGGLEISGDKSAFATVKDIPFRDRLKVAVTAREADSVLHVLGIRFIRPDGRDVLIFAAMATKLKAFAVFRREDDRTVDLLPDSGAAGGTRMEMEFARGQFSFRIGQRTLWTGKEAGFTEVAVLLGGLAYAKEGEKAGKACAVFREASVSGGVNPAWMRKTLAGYREALASELARERRVRRDGEKEEASVALSLDAVLAGAEARPEYETALGPIRQFLKSSEVEHFQPAADAAAQLTARHPGFAPGWYWRGILAEEVEDLPEAARHIEKALQCFADFPEALSARARLFALAGDEKAARGLVERAMAVKPDLGEAHLVAARLDHQAGRREAAMESAELARRLSPADPGLQARAQMLGNAIRGPLWARVNRHETAHYLLRSDLPAAKCRAYAEHLEAMRALYEGMLSLPSPEGRRAEVLVFNAPEGYYGYMEFTAGGRGEMTLGAFSAWYGQLVLFEDPEAEETLRVLGHEGFHQYLHGALPGAPIWFNEGMAEYVAASKVEKGKVVERGRTQEGRLANLRMALKYGWKPVPFEKVMVESQASFYEKHAQFKYAQAWSMVHWLLHGEKGGRAGLLAAYVKRLAAGDAAPAAFAATFGKEDVRAMEAAWLAYVGALGGGTAATAALAPNAPVNLLAMIDVRRDSVKGIWNIAGQRLHSPPEPRGGQLALLRFPYVPPAEYDLTLVVERREQKRGENGSLDVGLLGPGGLFAVVIDSREGRSFLNGGPAGDTPDSVWKGWFFTGERPRTLVFSVRKDGVTVSGDGAVLIRWRGDTSKLSCDYGMSGEQTLFLGAWLHYAFSRIELTPVTGQGVRLR